MVLIARKIYGVQVLIYYSGVHSTYSSTNTHTLAKYFSISGVIPLDLPQIN